MMTARPALGRLAHGDRDTVPAAGRRESGIAHVVQTRVVLFFKRWAQVAGAAMLVSAGSWLMLGPRYIWFGILHFIAVALLIGRALIPLGAWNLVLGLAVIAAGLLIQDAAFNETPANVIGFVTAKPRAEDYVPLFP